MLGQISMFHTEICPSPNPLKKVFSKKLHTIAAAEAKKLAKRYGI
jgi:hypothetical protein